MYISFTTFALMRTPLDGLSYARTLDVTIPLTPNGIAILFVPTYDDTLARVRSIHITTCSDLREA